MDIETLRTNHYFFDVRGYGRIFAFIDFGNVRHWAKDFWPVENKHRLCLEIDIKKLSEVCGWVNPGTKFFYYGHFARNTNVEIGHELNSKYRSSIFRIDKAGKSGFKTRTKEVKMIPNYDEDGKYLGKIPKCNFDVEITMDMIMKLDKYDTVMLFSGDSDFGKLLSYLKSKGKKIIVVCTRSRMSTELESLKDRFIPAETLKDFLVYKKDTPPFRAEA